MDYKLNVSLEGRDADSFLFKSTSVHDLEPNNDNLTAQILSEAGDTNGDNFFSLPDQEIGNTHLGGRITAGTPYVKITGSGDGTSDFYQFNISDDMLNSPMTAITPTNTENIYPNTYHTSATLTLNSTEVREGDEWTIYLDGRTFNEDGKTYSYRATSGDTLGDVATGLQAAINHTGSLRYSVSVDSEQLTITQTEAGFYLGDDSNPNGLTQKRTDAATVTRTATTRNKNNDADIDLTTANITLSGDPFENEVWQIIVGGITSEHIVTAGESLNDVAEELEEELENNGAATVVVSGPAATPTLTLTALNTGAAPVTVKISGSAPTGAAEISGTPDGTNATGDTTVTPWYEVTYDLDNAVGKNETWTLSINETSYSVVAGEYDNPNDIVSDLSAALATSDFAPTANSSELTLSNSTSFTTSLTIAAYEGNSTTQSGTADSAVVLADHDVTTGDLWKVEITYGTETAVYSELVDVTHGGDLNNVIDAIVTKINNDSSHDLIATNDDTTLVITHPSQDINGLIATVTQATKVVDLVSDLDGKVLELYDDLLSNEQWVFTLTNTNTANSRTYTITSTDDNEITFAASVADQINNFADDFAAAAYYVAVADGTKVYIASPDGSFGIETSRSQLADTDTYKTSVITFNDDLGAGPEPWTIKVTNDTTSNTHTYTIASNNDDETIFAELVADRIRDTADDSASANPASLCCGCRRRERLYHVTRRRHLCYSRVRQWAWHCNSGRRCYYNRRGNQQ